MYKPESRIQLGTRLIFLMIVLVAANTAFTIWSYTSIKGYFPSGATRLNYKQETAVDIAEYHRHLASELGVLDNPAVREALAGFNYDVEMCTSSEQLVQVILNQGLSVRETILREADAYNMDRVLAVVNQDENVRRTGDKLHLSIRIAPDNIIVLPDGYLHPSTVYRIQEIFPEDRLVSEQVVNIEVDGGKGSLMVPYNPIEHIQTLTKELDQLRVGLREIRSAAGLAEMSGPGITVNLYDEKGGVNYTSIIHDADIRDVVNELFGSGALGVSVGGQRLTATSSIRCSGSLVKVNDKLITVNPVEIKVIGDPDLLMSGLDIIRTTMELQRGLQFEIIAEESLTLPAYSRSVQ